MVSWIFFFIALHHARVSRLKTCVGAAEQGHNLSWKASRRRKAKGRGKAKQKKRGGKDRRKERQKKGGDEGKRNRYAPYALLRLALLLANTLLVVGHPSRIPLFSVSSLARQHGSISSVGRPCCRDKRRAKALVCAGLGARRVVIDKARLLPHQQDSLHRKTSLPPFSIALKLFTRCRVRFFFMDPVWDCLSAFLRLIGNFFSPWSDSAVLTTLCPAFFGFPVARHVVFLGSMS